VRSLGMATLANPLMSPPSRRHPSDGVFAIYYNTLGSWVATKVSCLWITSLERGEIAGQVPVDNFGAVR
jgi:hypothetical protein